MSRWDSDLLEPQVRQLFAALDHAGEPGGSAGARIVGVNNRDLRDFQVHLETSLELVESIPEDCLAVSESGLHSNDDLVRLRSAGFDAFLIGEHLMTRDDPGAALGNLLRPAGSAE